MQTGVQLGRGERYSSFLGTLRYIYRYGWAGERGTAASWALSGTYTGTAGQGREVQQLLGHSPVYIQVLLGRGERYSSFLGTLRYIYRHS